MYRSILAILLVSACGGGPINVRVIGPTPEGFEGALEVSADLLGVHFQLIDGDDVYEESVPITITYVAHDRCGLQSAPRDCRRFIFINPTCPVTTVAHEVGHALGLGHHEDAGNLMYWSMVNQYEEFPVVEDWQINLAQEGADVLSSGVCQ